MRIAEHPPQSRLFSRTLRTVLALALTAFVGMAATGCASLGTGGTSTITVPALWVDQKAGNSGVEPATISVTASDEPGFTADISQLDSAGAGKSWIAATRSASVIGTMFAGGNPNLLNFRFAITEAIDGPSAGALLTLGVIASYRHDTIDPTVSMTGTISPDGSIGQVSGIGLKIRGAKEAGLTTVLIPASISMVTNPETGNAEAPERYGDSVGVRVVRVSSLLEAYPYFTGNELIPTSGAAVSLSNDAAATARIQEQSALIVTDAAEVVTAGGAACASFAPELSDAKNALSTGDVNLAFGLSVDLILECSYAQALDAALQSALDDDALRASIVAQANAADAQLQQQLEQMATLADSMNESGLLSLPAVMSWSVYERAVIRANRDALKASNATLESNAESTRQHLAHISASIAQSSNSARIVSARTAPVVHAVSSSLHASSVDAAAHLSDYTEFYRLAGDANVDYIADVLGATPESLSSLPLDTLAPAVAAIRDNAAAVSSDHQAPAVEVNDFATMSTYVVMSTSLVASATALGGDSFASQQFNDDQPTEAERAARAAAIASADALTTNYGALAQSGNLNPVSLEWSRQWSMAAYRYLLANDANRRGTSLALNELWFDQLGVQTMYAFTLDGNSSGR